MPCTRFARKTCGGLAIATALLLAMLALPPGASADAHHLHPSGTLAAAGARGGDVARSRPLIHARSPILVARFGTGYARPEGSRRVRWIQRRLQRLGYAPGPVDGRFGPLTERAVTRFQASYRLRRDGEVGPITSTHLRRAHVAVRLGAGYARPGGSRRVRSIQRRLRERGYATGPVDGRFGPLTAHAVMRFQADHRLEADGVVGARTFTRLRRHAARPPSATGRAEEPNAAPPSTRPLPPAVTPPAAQSPEPHLPSPPGEAIVAVLLALGLLGMAVFAGSYVRTRARLARSTPVRRGDPVTDHNGERAR